MYQWHHRWTNYGPLSKSTKQPVVQLSPLLNEPLSLPQQHMPLPTVHVARTASTQQLPTIPSAASAKRFHITGKPCSLHDANGFELLPISTGINLFILT